VITAALYCFHSYMSYRDPRGQSISKKHHNMRTTRQVPSRTLYDALWGLRPSESCTCAASCVSQNIEASYSAAVPRFKLRELSAGRAGPRILARVQSPQPATLCLPCSAPWRVLTQIVQISDQNIINLRRPMAHTASTYGRGDNDAHSAARSRTWMWTARPEWYHISEGPE
jgi:hypothetical protein